MSTVANILAEKRDLWFVTPDQTAFDAVAMMHEKNVGALIVMDGDKLAGIVSERDFTRKIILKDLSAKKALVKDVMTSRVHYVEPEQTVEACLAMISKYRVRHLPVMKNKKVIGMISIGDVVKLVVSDQKVKIDHLELVVSWGESY